MHLLHEKNNFLIKAILLCLVRSSGSDQMVTEEVFLFTRGGDMVEKIRGQRKA